MASKNAKVIIEGVDYAAWSQSWWFQVANLR